MYRQQSTDRILELNATRNKTHICSISFHGLLISSEVHHAGGNKQLSGLVVNTESFYLRGTYIEVFNEKNLKRRKYI